MSEKEKSSSNDPSRVGITIQWIVNIIAVVIVGIAAFLWWDFYTTGGNQDYLASVFPENTAIPPTPTEQPSPAIPPELPAYKVEPTLQRISLNREENIDTEVPARSRVDVITYTVEIGDSIFSIADDHGVKAETVLWGNFELLEDNPHLLKPGQNLNILPVDGTYYQWNEGDALEQIAGFFKVDPQTIIDYPGNRFDLTESTVQEPALDIGDWLIIPDGWREIRDWGPPAITRNNPASAAYYGGGHCGAIYEGAIGSGYFVWPTTSRLISGYHYDPNIHPAIDIGGQTGNAIYAADSGVVVYAGWSDYGYGYLIVIDHGNGWQSAYAHLSAVGVNCGQSVFQGTVIGALGSTGRSSGPHLHFELVYNGSKVNPMNFLQ